MAKRRRLTPAPGLDLGRAPDPEETSSRFARETLETKSALSPIAAMAGEISRHAAIDEIAGAMDRARQEGRLAEALPLEAVVADHLIRDRAVIDEGEMAALVESLRARGQQVPIEVTDLGDGRYGLISGWRRLTALRRLAEEDAGPALVVAFLRRPKGDAEAYLAMVEENEIRADLGFWERGRIVARAVEHGVFVDVRTALNGLFGSVPRARRSKIGSFVALAQRLDGRLSFPQALTERLGLALAQRLKAADETGGDAPEILLATLATAVSGAATAEAEMTAISGWLSQGLGPARTARGGVATGPDAGGGASTQNVAAPRLADIHVTLSGPEGRQMLTISGPKVDAELRARIEAWLKVGAGR